MILISLKEILRTRENGGLKMLHLLQSLHKYCCYDCMSSSWSVRKHLLSSSPVLLATVRAYAFLACLHCTYEHVSPSSCPSQRTRLDARHTVIWASFSWIEMFLVRTKALFPTHFLSTQISQSALKKSTINYGLLLFNCQNFGISMGFMNIKGFCLI